ncbi:hypothetical protein [Tychonema sp. BBK16]|nr:hypothetical protein [Tychonema sp. BBK16]
MRSLIINKKGRSLFHFRRSHSVQLSQCLIFGVKGDRSLLTI